MNERYSRQILFKPIGAAGQEKLRAASVLIVGCGALGSAHAEMLVRAGVGRLRIVDRDFVEATNLQRQTLFTEAQAADRLPKAVAAVEALHAINADASVDGIVADVNYSNVEELIDGCDLVLDGTDNFQTRYLINDACVKLRKPWIYGAVVSAHGTTMTVIPGVTPCLRCVFPDQPEPGAAPTCDTAGVIMPAVLWVAAMQVTEAIKTMTDNVAALHGALLQFDVWEASVRRIGALREPDCKTCGLRQFDLLEPGSGDITTVLCGRDAVQITPQRPVTLSPAELAEAIGARSSADGVKANEYLVRFTAENVEFTVFRDGRAILKGVDDAAAARALYARYVGA